MNRQVWLAGALAISLIGGVSAPAQADANLAEVLSGKSYPLTMKLQDLNAEWRRVVIPGAQGGGMDKMLPQLMQMGMAADRVNGQAKPDDAAGAAMGMMMLNSLFGGGSQGESIYTRGQTVTVGTETFVVAYRLKKSSPMAGMAGLFGLGAPGAPGAPGAAPGAGLPGAPPKIDGSAPLTLSLLAVRELTSLDDIRPFDLNKEIEEANSAGMGGLMNLFGGLMGAGLGPAAQEATVATPAPARAAAKPAKPAPRKR